MDTDGQLLDDEEAEEYARLIWDDGLIAEAFKYSKKHCRSIDPKRSLYDFFVQKAEHLFLNELTDVAKRKRKAFLLVASMWGAYIGSPVHKQSLRFFWLEDCIEGENPFVAETYRKILRAVAEHAKDSADTKLEHKVSKIRSASLDETKSGDRPVLETNRCSEEFDEIVVTAPLGWLKQNQQAFEPALTARLSQAIRDVGYGSLDKVYITFLSAFWDVPKPGDQSISNGNDPERKTPNVTATTIPLHQPPAQSTGKHYPGFTHWLEPSYALKTNVERWDQQGMNLAALPAGCAHPTILFYIYGECSKHIANIVSLTGIDKERDLKLMEFFKPYYSLLPNYSDTNPDCIPKAVLATAWANDEFAGFGSYSNFQIGLENGDKDIEAMRYGMPEHHLWFAGEHTAPFAALGTTTGTYLSGDRVAERFIEARGLKDVR